MIYRGSDLILEPRMKTPVGVGMWGAEHQQHTAAEAALYNNKITILKHRKPVFLCLKNTLQQEK